MATPYPPKEPLVAILGTTGTGKSDLAVDLALRFNGEIINADAMQMYKGLPVITNQLSHEDQRGVPHHLLAYIDPTEPTYTVEVFAHEASRIIRDIRSRGKLPIVVGGTHYYIHSLLFEDALVSGHMDDEDNPQFRSREENVLQFPIIDGPTHLILERLREVDPEMADHWHPDDRRKIQRSLEIYLTTGKRASDIYAQQRLAKSQSGSPSSPWQSLMFWVYTDPETLKERLDKRVDKMYESGLMDEVRTLHESRRLRSEQGDPVNITRGIWQSIGYKQMVPFLEAEKDGADPSKIDQLKEAGLEEMRNATRQYARSQLRWIRRKSIPAFKEYDALDYLFLLDSSNVNEFSAQVLEPAAKICSEFLHGQPLAKPAEISSTANEVLADFECRSAPPSVVTKVRTCELCNITLQSDDQWVDHIRGRKHRRVLRGKKMRAMICLPQEEPSSEI
ncbi:tRNA isopentenyltransferase [Rostrohypoxylon terebratum]|nr:tRNA isopentenyltransferase [Rostrohypoxylon terebratum]